MPSLDQTQRLFWKLITAPEGVAAGRATLPVSDRADADRLARADTRLSAVERLDIYADMYFYRIRDCLKEDFPAVAAVVGETAFHNLITDYLLAHPSTHFSLRYVGRQLPAFVRQHALIERWPYLADLALLEWTIMEAFDAPDAEPITPTSLATVAADRWAELRFDATPSLRMLRLQWPVHEAWARTQREEDVSEVHAAPTVIRVWRQDLRVFHRPVDVTESAALDALTSGATFAETCESIAAVAGDAPPADRAVALLHNWLADGLLTAWTLEPSDSRARV